MKRLYAIVACAIFFFPSCISQPVQAPAPKPPKLFNGITIEVQPTLLSPYDAGAMSNFLNDLDYHNICSRSDIRVVVRPAIMTLKNRWASADVRRFETQHRRLWDHNLRDGHLILHISLLPGNYAVQGMRNVIGIKYGNRQSIALFQGAFGRGLLFHELGHVIGLVDRCKREGDPVNPARPNHCNTKTCTMFWTIDPNKVPRLDPLCRQDIQELIKKGRSNEHAHRHNQSGTTTPICTPRPQKR